MAGLGGVWQAVVLGFAGLDLMGDTLGDRPEAPARVAEPVVPRALAGDASCRSRIAGGVVQATLAAGEAMELRVAGNARPTGARRDAGGPPVGYRRRRSRLSSSRLGPPVTPGVASRPALHQHPPQTIRCGPMVSRLDAKRQVGRGFTLDYGICGGGWLAEAGVGERVAAWPTKRSSLRARSSRAIRSSVRAS